MWEIPFVFLVLVLALASFIWEKFPPDLTALIAFGLVLATGIVSPQEGLSVFSNPAPITVGAMFIISAALDKSGLIDKLGSLLKGMSNLRYAPFLLFIMLIAGTVSAFINNTPVVVVMLPIVLSLSKNMNIPGSKVLIPLSYASI
ncbi:MAG: SLC13 family permease, partial [Verrucomicrobiota bacterium]